MTKTIILDASVIVKWFFPEEGSEQALVLKEQITQNKFFLASPVLLYYEMNNILRTAVKAYRIDAQDATKALEAFLQLNIVAYSSEQLMEETLRLALRYDISSYDASYVALAEYLQLQFITADKKLLRKVNSPLVTDVESFFSGR